MAKNKHQKKWQINSQGILLKKISSDLILDYENRVYIIVLKKQPRKCLTRELWKNSKMILDQNHLIW